MRGNWKLHRKTHAKRSVHLQGLTASRCPRRSFQALVAARGAGETPLLGGGGRIYEELATLIGAEIP